MPSTSHLPAWIAGAVATAAIVTAIAAGTSGSPAADRATPTDTTPSPTPSRATASTWAGQPGLPVEVGGDLWVGGEQVPGKWWGVRGRGTRWIGVQLDRTWWWGNDARPQRMEGEVDQGPAISASGRYVAYVVGSGRQWTLVGIDTEQGRQIGAVDLPLERMSPPPRAVAVTDDGLVVAGGPRFQWLWRPLVDGATVDLSEAAPGQVVLGSTAAGLVVNEGRYGRTDSNEGTPYLADIAADGTLTRSGSLSPHDVLEASEQWLAWVSPGTIGGEAWTTGELQVQRLDGSSAGVLTAPEGWRFAAPGFQWETADRLLALLVSLDESDRALARCRPDTQSCELVDLPD